MEERVEGERGDEGLEKMGVWRRMSGLLGKIGS